jgi:hypothetical protein
MNEMYENPLFGHLPAHDIQKLNALFTTEEVKTGKSIDIKSTDNFYILRNGILQSEGALNKGESFYTAPGSFFGSIPFSSEEPRGSVKVLTDSVLLTAKTSHIRKYFLSSFPSLRGYIRMLSQSGISLAENIQPVYEKKAVVISVLSHDRNVERSALSTVLAKNLSEKDSTVIVDFSLDERSVFDYSGLKITPPLSEKKIGEGKDSYLEDRIVKRSERLFLLNATSGSKVKTDPAIVSPLISFLAGKYRYIIIDIGFHSTDIIHETLKLSDRVVSLYKNRREFESYKKEMGGLLVNGQTLHHMYFDSKLSEIKRSGRVWSIPSFGDSEDIGSLSEWSSVVQFSSAAESMAAGKKAIVLENTGYLSLGFSQLIPRLAEISGDACAVYASSFAFTLLAFYFNNPREYRKNIRSLFSDNALLSLLDVRYPGEHLLSDRSLKSLASRLKRTLRLEDLSAEIFTAFSSAGFNGVTSSGSLRDLAGTVLAEAPYTAPYRLNGIRANALSKALHPSFFMMRGFERIISIRLCPQNPVYPKNRSLYLFRSGLGADISRERQKWTADENIVIDVDAAKCNIKGMLTGLNDVWEPVIAPFA